MVTPFVRLESFFRAGKTFAELEAEEAPDLV